MAKNVEEREIPIRRHLIMYLNIFDAESEKHIGWLGDISENGIMIISPERLETNKTLHVRLKLPASEDFSDESVELFIDLLWSKPDRNPKYFCQGGLIKDIPETSKRDVEALVGKFGLADDRSLKEYTDYTD